MARPRSNLKPQLEWSRSSGAFEPPQFSMLDAVDLPRAGVRAAPREAASVPPPSTHASSAAAPKPACGPYVPSEPSVQPIGARQRATDSQPRINSRSIDSRRADSQQRETGAPPTPPSLHSEPDSDLDDLEAVMVVLPSDEAEDGTLSPRGGEVVIPSSSPSPSLSPSLSLPPPSSPPPPLPLPLPAARRSLRPEHDPGLRNGPASQSPPRPDASRSFVVTSSSPLGRPALPFRMEEAAPAEPASQGPEIGSLLSEKIAIQEQKIDALCRALAAHRISVDTALLDERLRAVDRRIERFAEEDLEPPGAAMLAPPQLLSSQASAGRRVTLSPLDEQAMLAGLDSDSDDDFGVVATLSMSQRTAGAGAGVRAGVRADSGLGSGVGSGAGAEYYPEEHAEEHAARFVDLVGTSSDFEDSPYFSTMNNSRAEDPHRADGTWPSGAVHIIDDDDDGMSSDIIMETAPPSLTTQYASQSKPWTKEMMYILRTKFGLSGFRPNQLEAVNETLAGNDLVVLMPTGGGKSLCYQLPALCTTGATSGTTVVISPLISLMQDQVYHLKNRNIQAEMINSKLSAAERNDAFARLGGGELQLVYLSPEMLSASTAMRTVLHKLHTQSKLARIVIDEAHCVSSWGHDFRPDYKELDRVKSEFTGTPIMALTATANERVLLDIVGCLRPNPVVLKQSFNRRNLVYEVRPKPPQVGNEIAAICRQFAGKTGIVYCFSKRSCEEMAADLRSVGIAAAHYHAGMDQDARAQTQQDWQDGRCAVVCATIAFGMGIDKPDVRFVVHQTLPRNIEGYYQETGRAGRDGRISTCVLFYTYSDVQLVRRMIDSDANLTYADKEHHRALLNRMLQYCENRTDCRRKQVLQYFNEEFDAKQCAFMCDNCQNMRGQVVLNKDLTTEARLLLQMAESAQSRQVTVQQCIDVMLGRNTKKVRDCGFDQLPMYGKLRAMGLTEIERLAHHLITEHGLEEYSVRAHSRYPQTYVRLGINARAVLDGRRSVKLKTVSGPVPSAGPSEGRPAGAAAAGAKRAGAAPAPFRTKRARAAAPSSTSGSRSYGGRPYARRARGSRVA